jgi:uncharacterized protein (DUF983 family)
MEKVGVQFDDEKTKTAGVMKKCPKCGRQLFYEYGYPKCETCGTEPFEQRLEEKK